MAKIFFWQGIVGDENLLQQYKDTFTKLLQGEYKAVNLKKLKGYRIFSIRLNDSNRVLFTAYNQGGNSYLLLLEIVLNHDYQKARFLKSNVLNYYLDTKAEFITQPINFQATDFSPITDKNFKIDFALPCAAEFTAIPLEWYAHQFIQLNSTQQAAKNSRLPMLIRGIAGSGKSCIALSLLKNSTTDCLYVTTSNRLVNSMEKMWQELPNANNHHIDFKTYHQLITELCPEINKKKIATDEDFEMWFKEYRSHYETLVKVGRTPGLDDCFLNNHNKIFQEFRIFSGYSPETYLTLGKGESLFNELNQKQWIIDAYRSYTNYLAKNDIIQPAFYSINSQPIYSLVVVDEAQDFSHLQLKQLQDLAIDTQICYLLDTHQSLLDNRSKTPFITKMLQEKVKHEITRISLPIAYRCPKLVITAANALIDVKNRLIGGIADKEEQLFIECAANDNQLLQQETISWLTDQNCLEFSNLMQAINHCQIAIVTSSLFIEEARSLFNNPPLLFTPAEIKGLEFDTVVAYRLFDHAIFKEANHRLKTIDLLDKKAPTHRPKEGRGEDKYGPPFHQILTAFTRALRKLYIFQQITHDNDNLIRPVKKIIDEPKKDRAVNIEEEQFCPIDWLEEAKKLKNNDNYQQAKTIFINKLAKTEEEFASFWSNEIKKEAASANRPPLAIKTKTTKLNSTKTSKLAFFCSPAKDLPEKSLTAVPVSKVLPVKVKTRKEEYLQNLSNRFNEKNLKNCLTHGNAAEYLFDLPNQISCLLLQILDDKEKYTILHKVLCADSHLSGLFSTARLSSITDKNTNTSLLLLILKKECGINFLILLIHLGIDLISIPIEIWISIAMGDIPEEEKISCLFLLAKTGGGHEILLSLLKQFPDFAKRVPAYAWIYTLSKEAGKQENTSPLYYLSSTETGREAINLLLKINHSLIAEIPAISWTRPLPAAAGMQANMSPLYFLSSTESGLQIIYLLLSENYKLAQEIPVSAWTMALTKDALSQENVSPFYCLAGSHEGRQIINLLLKNNRNFAMQISPEAFALPRTQKEEAQENITPLYLLCYYTDGQNLIYKFLTINPALAGSIPIAAWLIKPTKKFASHQYSALQLLVQSERGRDILLILGNKNAELKKIIAVELHNANFFNQSMENKENRFSHHVNLAASFFTAKITNQIEEKKQALQSEKSYK